MGPPGPSPGPAPWTPPPEGSDILNVIRLGWHFAQLRGLYDPRVYRDPDPPYVFDDNAMRLTDEWTRAGKADEAEEVVVAMASAVGTNVTLRALALADADLARLGTDSPASPPTPDTAAAAVLGVLRERLQGLRSPNGSGPAPAPPPPGPTPMLGSAPGTGGSAAVDPAAWGDFTWYLRTWDEYNQQSLIARSPRLAAGYRLGRALAEIRWALHESAGEREAASWNFLLGSDRRQRLERLVNRVSPALDPLTPICLSTSLRLWQKVASDRDWREASLPWLSRQAHLWHDLITNERTPTSLIQADPIGVLRRPSRLWPVLKQFRFEIVLTLLCLGAFAVAAWILYGNPAPNNTPAHTAQSAAGAVGKPWLASVIAILGLFGFTFAGVAAGLRNSVHGLTARLKTAYNAALASEASVVIPPMPWPPPDDNGCIVPAPASMRAVGFLIDLVLANALGIVTWLVVVTTLAVMLPSMAAAVFASDLDVVIAGVTPLLYFVIGWARFGSTPGMMPFQMRIVGAADGRHPSLPRVLIRLSVILFTLGLVAAALVRDSIQALVLAGAVIAVLLLSIALDKRRRGLHDWVSGTWVVRVLRDVATKPRGEPARPPVSA